MRNRKSSAAGAKHHLSSNFKGRPEAPPGLPLGITLRGEKIILGFVQSSTKNGKVCAAFLPSWGNGGCA